jgi:pimeloyl-ACP methyl ester carboxylesterase
MWGRPRWARSNAIFEDGLVSPWSGRVGQSAFYRQIAQADERHTDEIEPLYGRVAAPTLVVWGEDDRWIPAQRGRELARRIPGARLELLPAAGHLVQEDQPEELARLLGRHLSSISD